MYKYIKSSVNASSVLHALSQYGFTKVGSNVSTRTTYYYKDFYNDEYGYFELRVWEPGYAVEIICYEDVVGRDFIPHEVGRIAGVPVVIRNDGDMSHAMQDITNVISAVKGLRTMDYVNSPVESSTVVRRSTKVTADTSAERNAFSEFIGQLEDAVSGMPSSKIITVGDIFYLSSMYAIKAFIYDVNSGEPLCDGEYLSDVMNRYPGLKSSQVVELTSRGSHYLSLHIKAEFEFEPAW